MRRRAAAASLLVVLAAGCTREQWHRFPSPDDLVAAFSWFSVMHTGIAIQPYKLPLQPVEGTVPVTGTVVVPRPFPQNRALLDRLTNPAQSTAESLERGRDRYEIYCLVCHGAEGRGDGPVAQSMGGVVRDLTIERMRDLSDGWIYGVTTHGFGLLMPEYGSKIRDDDRWHVVNYVRLLQGVSQ
ncbi:MAG: c-type cytochrome [Gemmatimonadales bacterium]